MCWAPEMRAYGKHAEWCRSAECGSDDLNCTLLSEVGVSTRQIFQWSGVCDHPCPVTCNDGSPAIPVSPPCGSSLHRCPRQNSFICTGTPWGSGDRKKLLLEVFFGRRRGEEEVCHLFRSQVGAGGIGSKPQDWADNRGCGAGCLLRGGV